METGLWSTVPADCWDLEVRLIEKQQADFHLLAPDEPAARSKFETKHPDKLKDRQALLSRLRPVELFSTADDEEEIADLDGSEDTEAEEVDA